MEMDETNDCRSCASVYGFKGKNGKYYTTCKHGAYDGHKVIPIKFLKDGGVPDWCPIHGNFREWKLTPEDEEFLENCWD